MLTKNVLLGVLVTVIVIVGFAGTAVGSGSINIFAPGGAKMAPIVPPQLLPPDEMGFVLQQPGSTVVASDGRPVAQLVSPPADLSQSFAARIPEIRSNDPQIPEYPSAVSYGILSTLRYRGNGHTVLVTTTRPSVAAAQRETYLGDLVTLSTGAQAWVRTGLPGSAPNQVVTIHDDLIITVASDLPINALEELAAHVVVK